MFAEHLKLETRLKLCGAKEYMTYVYHLNLGCAYYEIEVNCPQNHLYFNYARYQRGCAVRCAVDSEERWYKKSDHVVKWTRMDSLLRDNVFMST